MPCGTSAASMFLFSLALSPRISMTMLMKDAREASHAGRSLFSPCRCQGVPGSTSTLSRAAQWQPSAILPTSSPRCQTSSAGLAKPLLARWLARAGRQGANGRECGLRLAAVGRLRDPPPVTLRRAGPGRRTGDSGCMQPQAPPWAKKVVPNCRRVACGSGLRGLSAPPCGQEGVQVNAAKWHLP